MLVQLYALPTKEEQYDPRYMRTLETEMRQHGVPLKTRLQWHSRIFGGRGGMKSEQIFEHTQRRKPKGGVYIFPYIKTAPPEVNRIVEATYRQKRKEHEVLIRSGKMTEKQSKAAAGVAAWKNVRKAGYIQELKPMKIWVKKRRVRDGSID